MADYIILMEVVCIVMIFAALRLLLVGDGAREQKLMGYFLCGSLVQNMGYFLEMTAPTVEVAVAAIKIEYLGSLFVPMCYCQFLYEYCYEKIPKKIIGLVGIANFVMLPVIFTCDHNTLFYKSMELLSTPYGYNYLSLEYGPLYYPSLITRILIPYALSFYILCKAITTKRTDKTSRGQYVAIMVISTLPVVALIAYICKFTQVFDLTPGVLGISLSVVVIFLWSRRNYDFRHIAADVVLDSMADGVVALDDQKRLISCNKAAEDILTRLRSHKLGEYVGDMKVFSDDMLSESSPHTFEINGRFYESHTKHITDSTGKDQGYAMLVIDMTDNRNHIEEIKRVRRQAEQANKAKSEFLANMSHEIRTPMNAIIGLSDIIMEESHGQKIYSYAKDVQSASRNLLSIINDILDLSKVEAGKMELVYSDYHIKALTDEVVGMMDMAASKKGLVMKHEYDMSMPCMYRGDEGRIKQILINLLNNAIKFTSEGHVKISVSGVPGRFETEEIILFKIEDTGCGIKKEDQDKIFDNFKQVNSKRNRSVEGTGLGLAIVRHLVQLMSGSIELTSEYGVGSVFTITLPQKIIDRRTLHECPEALTKEVAPEETFTAEGYKVLIVDDNLVNRKVAQGFLKNYRFELYEAASGPESIELVKNNMFDIIFMDHMMPEMDGIEAVKIIRSECGENGRKPVIIALTANAMEGVKEKFLSSGFQDFIAKPLGRKQLNELLLRWIPEERRKTKENGAGEESGGIDPQKINIEGIDMQAVMKYHSGSEADYKELLELYCIEGKRKAVLLRKLVEEENYDSYGIEVHGLKSASANIGAIKLSNLAREHEEAADKGDEEYINTHFGELLDSYMAQTRYIQNFLDKSAGDNVDAGNALPAISTEEINITLKEALELLEDFHSKECAAKIKGLLGRRLEHGLYIKLKELQERLRMYEDDEAEQLLHELLEQPEKKEKH